MTRLWLMEQDDERKELLLVWTEECLELARVLLLHLVHHIWMLWTSYDVCWFRTGEDYQPLVPYMLQMNSSMFETSNPKNFSRFSNSLEQNPWNDFECFDAVSNVT